MRFVLGVVFGGILIGDSAASIHCTGDPTFFYKKRFPGPDDTFSIIGHGKKIAV